MKETSRHLGNSNDRRFLHIADTQSVMTSNFTQENGFNADEMTRSDVSETDASEGTPCLVESSLTEVSAPITLEVQALEGRKRRLSASITVPYPLENLWQILTDYDQLAEFIPSLKESRRTDAPSGHIRIEQVGSQSFLKLKFCARVVLDMVEEFPTRISFQMVEGDFKEFYGEWLLSPALMDGPSSTQLTYTLNVLPSRLMPVRVIEKRLSHNLQINLVAIYHRANTLFGQS